MHFLAIIILANDSAISSSYSCEIFCHFLESSHAHSARGLRTANMLVTVMCAFVFFIAIIAAYLLCQMWANSPAVINSLEPCSSSKGKRKFCHGFLTSSMKCEMWHFQVIVMQLQQRNVQKVCCMCKVHVLSCLLDPILFFWWTFLLPSSLILFPLFSINMGRCLYEHQY